jgi:pilus assembly protein CpaE
MPPRFCLYYQTPGNGEYLEKFISAEGLGQLLETRPLSELPEAANSGADVLFLEYQEDSPPLDRFIERAARDPQGPAVFLYLKELTTNNLRKALRLGVRECFTFPLKAEEFQEAINRLPRRMAAAGPEATRLVAFLSCKGGAGNTFLAANTATLLAREGQGPVLLVDLDLRYGQLVHFFEARPKHTIFDAVENQERLDGPYLKSLLFPLNRELFLLPAPARMEEAELVTGAQLAKILGQLQELHYFSWALLDCCHQVDEVVLKALELSERLLLVLTPSIPALANAKKLLEVLGLLDLQELKVDLWLNCWQKQGDLSLGEIAGFLGREVAGTVAFEPAAVGRSINEGRPLAETAPGHPVCQDLKKIAASLRGREVRASAGPGWSWLKRFRRKA